MDGEGRERLPLNHPNRIRARDLKLYRRDEERAARDGISNYRCPCNLCGGRRRPCSRRTISRHFQSRGRHGALRGWTEVIEVFSNTVKLDQIFISMVCITVNYWNSNFLIIFLLQQGDDYDSSDNEWETHIGHNARAFLGLNEPIEEIPLDGGVGVARMVRDVLQRADDIHQAAMDAAENDMDGTDSGSRSGEEGREYSDGGHPFESGDPMENLSDSAEPSSEDDDLENFEDARNEFEPNINQPLSSSEGDSDVGNYSDGEEEDLEELLGHIPNGRIGDNPALDIAGTLPLFEGATLSMLSATLLILNCCRTHNVSNAFINEMLMLLCMSILPSGNVLPKSEYEASKMLKHFGLAYDIIHACPKGCCLFRGVLENDDTCPQCGSGRYRRSGRSLVPALVLRHFPLISRLQRMFSSKKLSELNTWHNANRSTDGKMRHTADSPQWKFVDTELEAETAENRFGSDPRHIHLGMATDGFNPWSEKRSTDSMWPVMFLNYNLPPWLVTKKYFIMLCLLIPTKISVTSQNFDVFLQPAIDELQELWTSQGVRTRDARALGGESHFNLRACLMWTLHDFPGYGLVAGLTTKGFKACPVCGPNTVSRYSKVLRKNVFCNCHRRYLHANHYFRGDYAAFDYGAEEEFETHAMSGNDTIRHGRESERFLQNGGTEHHVNFPGKAHGVKRVSALFQLSYWRVSGASYLYGI